jgi:hypothetical protein
MNSNASTDSSTSTPSSDAISRRAYELWEQEGRPEGNDMRHWLQAEKELGGSRSASTEPSRYTDQPQARPTANDSRPLQGQSARPTGSSNRDGKRSSQSPFPAEKSGTNGGTPAVAGRRRA